MYDLDLKNEVKDALDWEPALDARAISISVRDGIVTLTGSVPSYPEKHLAEQAAGLVRGVKAVACELSVALPALSARTDEEIARAAADAIAWNTLLGSTSIQVFVDKGRVTLEGAVSWQYQRQSADRAVRYLAGVRDVNNHIVVRPVAERSAVKSQIEAALIRNARLDAGGIRVDVRDGHVILSGTVQSWLEREEAERAAWSSPGVGDVDNGLIVNPVSPYQVR
ncbi:MAG TPA: BON domain-containing protein [Bryobacteraceae bacterium]|nr:BON domain-containing protein [Bryobacteraceae bacterium]